MFVVVHVSVRGYDCVTGGRGAGGRVVGTCRRLAGPRVPDLIILTLFACVCVSVK